MDLDSFAARYPPAAPRIEAANADQLRHLQEADGVRHVTGPPVETAVRRTPRGEDCRDGRHLWVFLPDCIPYLLEAAPEVTPPLDSGVAKHTNLTGGAPACCGGELWIDPVDDDKIYVNGASGRYGPTSPKQLSDAEDVFRAVGLAVVGFGWDDDADLPARVLR